MAPANRRLHRNRKPQIKQGDLYRVTNTTELVDVDGDGSADLTLSHTTTRNGELFFETKSVWYGIDPFVAEAFQKQLAQHLGENFQLGSFGQLVKHWRALSKIMDKVTDIGTQMAAAIGEPAND